MSLTKVTNSMISGSAINVLDYGADPTGLTECSAQIQAALTFAYTSGNVLYIPSGRYLVNTSLDVGAGNIGDIVIYGNNATLKTTNTTIQGILYIHGDSAGNRGGRVFIQGVYFEGISKANANIALRLQDLQGVNVQNCKMSFVGKGIRTYNVDIATFANKNYISNCGTGIECDGPSGGQANSFGIQGNLINLCDVGIEYRGGLGANICFNEIDNNNIHVRCGFAGSGSYVATGTTIAYNKFESSYVDATNPQSFVIYLGGGTGTCANALVEHNTILTGASATVGDIVFQVTQVSDNTRIKNNYVAKGNPAYAAYTLVNSGSAVPAYFSQYDTGQTGLVTIAGAATTAVVTFDEPEINTNYNVLVTPNGVAGAPATNAFIVKQVYKTTSNFTLEVVAAPGGVTSIAYAWKVERSIF